MSIRQVCRFGTRRDQTALFGGFNVVETRLGILHGTNSVEIGITLGGSLPSMLCAQEYRYLMLEKYLAARHSSGS